MAEKITKLLNRTRKATAPDDGRDETALALASSVAGLSFKAASRLAWNKSMKALPYGLKTAAGVRRLKENLSRLLPQAADWIEAAPIRPDNTLGAVADLVAAAKRASSQMAPAPSLAIPAIHVRTDLFEMRSHLANALGKDFAAKASDRFVYRAGMYGKAAPGLDLTTAPSALILEMREDADPPSELPFVAARETVGEAMAALLDAGTRARAIETFRAGFQSRIASMRAELERSAAPVAAARESGSPQNPATEVCWLNGAIRVLAKPRDVAYCASDSSVLRIGIPRLLEREMDVSIAAIGATSYRAAQHLDGTGIQVAVIDGECDPTHPALAGRIVQKRNFTQEPWGSPDPHGTAVAGILCSSDAQLGGACPGATILNYKVFTTHEGFQGTDFAAALAIQSALEDGCRVANLSWGLGLGASGDSREARAVNRAWRFGLVLVKSAGNRGPAAGTLTSPADARDVIVVGATNHKGTAVEPYSSRGPNGAHLGPDLVAPGANVATQIQGLLLAGKTGSAGWGTSFSAPHVTGLITLLLHQSPSLKPDEIRAILTGKCAPVANALPDVQGFGFVRIA